MAKIVLSILLIVVASVLVFVQNIWSIQGGGYAYHDKTVVSQLPEVTQFVTEKAKATAVMNLQEIVTWVVFPSLLISGVFLLWTKKKFLGWKMPLPLLGSLAIIFMIATITNRIGVSQELKEELPIWETNFMYVQDPLVTQYLIEDVGDPWASGVYGRISTFDPEVLLVEFNLPEGSIRRMNWDWKEEYSRDATRN